MTDTGVAFFLLVMLWPLGEYQKKFKTMATKATINGRTISWTFVYFSIVIYFSELFFLIICAYFEIGEKMIGTQKTHKQIYMYFAVIMFGKSHLQI